MTCNNEYTCLDQNDKRSCSKCGFNCTDCDFETGQCKLCLNPQTEFPDPINKRDCRTCGDNCFECDFTTLKCK